MLHIWTIKVTYLDDVIFHLFKDISYGLSPNSRNFKFCHYCVIYSLLKKIYKLLSRSVLVVTKTYVHCFVTTLQWLLHIDAFHQASACNSWANLRCSGCSPLGENRCETGLLNWVFHTLLYGYVSFIWCTFTSQEHGIAAFFITMCYVLNTNKMILLEMSSMSVYCQFVYLVWWRDFSTLQN